MTEQTKECQRKFIKNLDKIGGLIHGELNCETAANDNAVMWRCFHCSEAFRFDQQKEAAEHFGSDSSQTPVCLMRIPGERHLIKQFRKIYDELQMYRNDDNRYMRIIEGMESAYLEKMKREEEIGYARGLHDSNVEFERKEKELRDKYHEGYERLNEEYKHLRTFKDMVNLVLTRNHVPQNVPEGNRLEWVFENYKKIEPEPEAEPEEKQPVTFLTVLGLFGVMAIGYLLGLYGGTFNYIFPAIAGVAIFSALLWDVCHYYDDDEKDDEAEKDRGYMS